MPRIKNTSPMTETLRGNWLITIAKVISVKFRQKYQNGMKEHKSDLGSVPLSALIDEMEAEALDQLAYINELRRRVTLDKKQ